LKIKEKKIQESKTLLRTLIENDAFWRQSMKVF